MGRVSEVVDWVYYSCMVVPSEMVKPQALDALKSVFNFSFVHDLNHCDVRRRVAAHPRPAPPALAR